MQVYNFKICHKKDSENVMADALLRLEYEVRNEMWVGGLQNIGLCLNREEYFWCSFYV